MLLCSDITFWKVTSPKLGLGQGFVFIFSGEWRHPGKESEDHWTNETCEEKGKIIQKSHKKKSKLAHLYIVSPAG